MIAQHPFNGKYFAKYVQGARYECRSWNSVSDKCRRLPVKALELLISTL